MQTMILFDGPLNAAASALLAQADLLAQGQAQPGNSLQYRLPAGQLDLVHGRPRLVLPDARGFLRLLDKRGGTLTAFATARAATLRRLHGTQFVMDHQCVELRYLAGKTSWAYQPRLVQFVARDIAFPSRVASSATPADVVALPGSEPPGLFFDPWLVSAESLADPRTLQAWCQAGPRFASRANALVLPPVQRAERREGPFDPLLVEIRRQLFAGEDRRTCAALVSLIRLQDHPLVADLIAEGARLGWVGATGQPTRARLVLMRPRRSDAVARYRWHFWRGDRGRGHRGEVAWQSVRRALRRDLGTLLGCRVVVRHARRMVSAAWDPVRPNEFPTPSASPMGAWEPLSAFFERLPPPLRDHLTARVLRPSQVDGAYPDHDLAERLALACLAPAADWRSQEAFENWRSAFSAWLTQALDPPSASLPSRAERRSLTSADGPRQPAPHHAVFYPPQLTDSALAVAQLLAPFGTRFIPDRQPRLDVATLDGGYHLG
ncbi:MAG: hypothetical protein U0935_20875 [Pirellulales bacterium]